MMYDLVVLGYAKNYLPIFTELESKHNIYLIPPPWSNRRELLHFLLRMDLAYKKEIRSLETRQDPRCSLVFDIFNPGILASPNSYSSSCLGIPNHNRSLGKSAPSADTSTCYIFFRDWYPLFASGYIKRVKELAPHTKACWFFSDLVDSYPGINVERMQSEFDLILSFDPEDAERYGFVYCPLSYSPLSEAERLQKLGTRSDVFFMGSAKQRLDMIFAVYERLRNVGLDCDFHIVGVPLQEQRYADEINYCTFLPYMDYLRMALSSRCILELLQDPTHHGFTARTGEALVYGRKLLSNNTSLTSAPFYDQRQIGVFSHPEKMNIDFITNDLQPACLPSVFSPRHTLKLIEERLNISFAVGK